MVKNPPAMRETWVWSWYWDDTPEKGMATHSNILAWRILLTIQSMGSQRVRHDWGTFTDIFRSRVSLQNPEGPLERELLQFAEYEQQVVAMPAQSDLLSLLASLLSALLLPWESEAGGKQSTWWNLAMFPFIPEGFLPEAGLCEERRGH